MPAEDEGILIARARCGDREAFDQLYERYAPRVLIWCRRIVHHAEDAEDAAAETWVRVWRALGSFRGAAKFSTWLSHIAQNVCTDMGRRRRDQPSLDDPNSLLLREMPHPGPTPEEAVVGARQPIIEAIREEAARAKPPWDPLDHAIFEMMCGKIKTSFEEMARLLDLPASTVRSRVHKHIKPVLDRVRRNFGGK